MSTLVPSICTDGKTNEDRILNSVKVQEDQKPMQTVATKRGRKIRERYERNPQTNTPEKIAKLMKAEFEEKWKEKPMQELQLEMRVIEVDTDMSYSWPRMCNVMDETESLIVAIQDQA